MMKYEFDKLVGIATALEAYERIEIVYLQFDELFPTKQVLASYYKKHDMNGIVKLYQEALKVQKLENKVKDLQEKLESAMSCNGDLAKKNDYQKRTLEAIKEMTG